MRFFLLAVLLCAVLLQTQAQTQKGNGILGGGVSANYMIQKSEFFRSPTITPRVNLQIGHFIANNWMLGVNLAYSGRYSKSLFIPNDANTSRLSETSPEINPFFRRYWSVGPMLLFAGAGIEASFNNSSLTTPNSNGFISSSRYKTFSINPTVEAGATYFLSKRLALQGTINGVGLPIPASGIGLGLVYWMGPNGTGKENPETTLTTTQAGNWVVEGGFTGRTAYQQTIVPTQNKETTTNSLALNASIGRFIAENTLLGVGLGFSSEKTEATPIFGPNQTYSISPFVQRYLNNRRLTPFLRATILYSNSGPSASDDRINSIQGVLGAGLAYRINNRFLVETSLGNISYQLLRFNTDSQLHSANLSAQLGSGFSLRYVIAGIK